MLLAARPRSRGFLADAVSVDLDEGPGLVGAQTLDGISAAVLGIMGPLVVADLTRGTGRFNLGQGIIGTAVGIGASLSTTLAGYMSDHLGNEATFLGLAAVAAAGLALVFTVMPETRPADDEEESSGD